MSKLQFQALENAFRVWKEARMAGFPDDKAFERFSTEILLKDSELADEEIASGDTGGGGDGGVDSFFFFIDRILIRKDNVVLAPTPDARLMLIQSTLSQGFDEHKIDKLEKFCRYLLDWEDLTLVKHLNQKTRENMLRFRSYYERIFAQKHTLAFEIHYVSRSIKPPSSNILARIEELKKYINSKIAVADVSFHPWDCASLLDANRSAPQKTLTLEKVQHLGMPDTSVVCLCTVASYAKFISESDGTLRAWLMEPNVRDYLGNTVVNKQIRGALNSESWTEDFWWLNNGVTILADKCQVSGQLVSIENPEVVNGLQTSREIFNARNLPDLYKRHIMVKIVVTPNDRSKNAIIKATNSQSPVSPLTLKATDPLQFDIEDRLLRLGLFYERRKAKYRQQKKPIAQTVSIKAMGQAIIACYLQLPSDARARPETVLKHATKGPLVFNDDYDRDFYAACILIDRACVDYLSRVPEMSEDTLIDIRYYVAMLATAELCGKAQPSVDDIVSVLPRISEELTDDNLEYCWLETSGVYYPMGGNDKVAKARDMENALKGQLTERFPEL